MLVRVSMFFKHFHTYINGDVEFHTEIIFRKVYLVSEGLFQLGQTLDTLRFAM